MKELYKVYRPKAFKDIIGQKNAVKVLSKMIEQVNFPHTLLLSGPSGCGKTTIARILRRRLNCGIYDFTEINCADFRGIDMIRDIRSRMLQAPIDGDCRIWLIDEAHKLSSDAQNAFLKMLEDTPKHVYFFLATTEPQKLIKTIRTRSTEIVLNLFNTMELEELICKICKQEKVKLDEEVVDKIVENSEGSARKALVFLNQIIKLDSKKEMLEAIIPPKVEKNAIEIAKALLYPNTKWKDMQKLLSEVSNEEPETIRWMIINYAKSIMLGGGGKVVDRAYVVIDKFHNNFYDSKFAGLVATCYEVLTTE